MHGTIFDIISQILAFTSVVSIIGNIIQYVKKNEQNKEMKAQMQMQYNNYNFIARVCTRIRTIEEDSSLNVEEKAVKICSEVNIMRGMADSARLSILGYSREHLGYEPFFEHPAFPGRRNFPDEVILGLPPEKSNNQSA